MTQWAAAALLVGVASALWAAARSRRVVPPFMAPSALRTTRDGVELVANGMTLIVPWAFCTSVRVIDERVIIGLHGTREYLCPLPADTQERARVLAELEARASYAAPAGVSSERYAFVVTEEQQHEAIRRARPWRFPGLTRPLGLAGVAFGFVSAVVLTVTSSWCWLPVALGAALIPGRALQRRIRHGPLVKQPMAVSFGDELRLLERKEEQPART